MKKFLKYTFIIIIALILIGGITSFAVSEKKPVGETGPAAEALTDKMFNAINKEAWDTTHLVTWSYAGHDYLWDKKNEWLKVSWGNKIVLMDLPAYEGTVYKNGEILEGRRKNRLFNRAYAFFCNDSFWLNAPAKARDEGTTRTLVKMEDGSDGLMVSYASGGVTPGDTYLWLLDENGRPTGWKMWVKILPFKGLYTSWADWVTLDTGAQIASMHGIKSINLPIGNLDSGQTYEELGIENPFSFK